MPSSICASLQEAARGDDTFWVITLESINQEAILDLPSSKFSCLFLENCRTQVTDITPLPFSIEEKDWHQTRTDKGDSFLVSCGSPFSQEISSKPMDSVLTGYKWYPDPQNKNLWHPFSLFRPFFSFQVPLIKVLLPTVILNFSHSLLWLP